MRTRVADADFTLLQGHVIDCLRELPDESVHAVVTSPPFWGLRAYGTDPQVWPADKSVDCEHEWSDEREHGRRGKRGVSGTGGNLHPSLDESGAGAGAGGGGRFCSKCGAWLGELGLEPTPQLYVEHMVAVFREVKRVLRHDGTCWLNIGDSYGGDRGNKTPAPDNKHRALGDGSVAGHLRDFDLRKQLVGIPWRLVFALQDDGWWVRAECIWHKPAAMPESVRDRPSRDFEHVFLLAKGERYFWDQEAVREAHTSERWGGPIITQPETTKYAQGMADGSGGKAEALSRPGREWNAYPEGGRNMRSVWSINTANFSEAHFAVFPEQLVSRCIAASTAEKGCCPECGAPWKRIVEREGESVEQRMARAKPGAPTEAIAPRSDGGLVQQAPARLSRSGVESKTLGWEPTCAGHCEVHDFPGGMCVPPCPTKVHAEPVPCTVLDPFLGSGTTGIVARKTGRRSVGIELNEEYAAMIERRLGWTYNEDLFPSRPDQQSIFAQEE